MVLHYLLIAFLAKLNIYTITDECCYIYGSVPYNDTNRIPEGGQLVLNYIIYNPHDNFTNVSVIWFRSSTKDRSTYEVLSTFSEEYQYATFHTSLASSSVDGLGTNCSLSLYRDTYSILIYNFTKGKNGYYWCQLAINNTYTQPSHYAWFYAGHSNSTACSPPNYPYFRTALSNEIQCAQYVVNAFPLMTPTSTTSTLRLSTSSQTTSSAISKTSESNSLSALSLIYILGSFSALLLIVLLGVLVLALSLAFYVNCLRKKASKLYL